MKVPLPGNKKLLSLLIKIWKWWYWSQICLVVVDWLVSWNNWETRQNPVRRPDRGGGDPDRGLKRIPPLTQRTTVDAFFRCSYSSHRILSIDNKDTINFYKIIFKCLKRCSKSRSEAFIVKDDEVWLELQSRMA